MGDIHFIIRHGLTGFVFLVFVLLGISILNVMSGLFGGEPFLDLSALSQLSEQPKDILPVAITVLTTAFITTPVIGVIVQGAYTAWLYWDHYGDAFGDQARRELASYVRRAVATGACSASLSKLPPYYCKQLQEVRDDSLFVWLYHTRAQPHLIEWARRRRSYHYLGRNWTIAAISGILLGILVPFLYTISPSFLVLCIVIATSFWIVGLLYLSGEMERDVDDMEFVWTLSQLYPAAFEAVVSGKHSNSLIGLKPAGSMRRRHYERSKVRAYLHCTTKGASSSKQ